MLEYKNLNKISKELLESIPEMSNEVVFQMLNGHKNSDPDLNEREKMPYLYGKTQIPTYEKIKDPFANSGKGSIVEIGVPEKIINGEVVSYRPFLAGNYGENIFNGKFSLMKGKIQDEELYEVFWLLNENESNPHRDKSVKPLFKVVNHKEDLKLTLNKVDYLRRALKDLEIISADEIMEFAASQNWAGDIDSMTLKVNDYAKSNPEKYLVIREDKNTSIKAKIKNAIDEGIIVIDYQSGNVTKEDNVLFTIPKNSLKDTLTAIANWINTSKNGSEVYSAIQRQLSAKEKPVEV